MDEIERIEIDAKPYKFHTLPEDYEVLIFDNFVVGVPQGTDIRVFINKNKKEKDDE